jgi:hypothetical protein
MPPEHVDAAAEERARRRILIPVAVIAVLLIGGFFYLLMRMSSRGPSPPEHLEGGIRAGSPEFDQYRSRIFLEEPEAYEATSVLRGLQMRLRTTVRNFTGRTIDGLEMYAAVVDHQGQPVKQRTVVVIPARQPELAPNKTMPVEITIEGFSATDDRANIKMDVTAFKSR